MHRPRILVVDAYDSFANSIIALIRREIATVTVECIKIHDSRFVLNDDAFFQYLRTFDAVVAGPGPGHPANIDDVGLIGKLWNLPETHALPVLGICLGFQSLCLAFGAQVDRLKEPRHGFLAMVTHCGKDVFANTGKIVATQYHSLHVNLQRQGPGDQYGARDLWEPSERCSQLVPLAWSLMNVPNPPTLMAVRHVEKPLWGVQYHPESICTNGEGQKLIRHWWKEVCEWRARKGVVLPPHQNGLMQESRSLPPNGDPEWDFPASKVHWSTLKTSNAPNVGEMIEMLRREGICDEPLLLESGLRNGRPVNPETGRFSIIGLPDALSNQVRYSTKSGILDVIADNNIVFRKQASAYYAFTYIDQLMRANKATAGPPSSPFWGGLIGFISYEAGLETIDVPPAGAQAEHPDIWFVFVERSIVVDHAEGVTFVQSLRASDTSWLDTTCQSVKRCCERMPHEASGKVSNISARLIQGPEQEAYCQKVRDCQARLRAGDSYELCLTDQSTIQTSADAWIMYKQLRQRNPAPFSSYLRLQSANDNNNSSPGLSVVGSSPERFLSWSRQGKCQFRPIKGTVKKGPGVTRAKAEEILGSAKERAENLMIVDLIRHDLAGVASVQQVRVPQLMSIEEYETVFQLVSVIEGDLEPPVSGTAALAASLPPGSMTGAPKKRSCELLQEIEGGRARGLYSGVIGYLDVGGAGDFSVVIRTAFQWDDDAVRRDEWRIGAGGAITALSEPESEWEEMVTKRDSVLNSFL